MNFSQPMRTLSVLYDLLRFWCQKIRCAYLNARNLKDGSIAPIYSHAVATWNNNRLLKTRVSAGLILKEKMVWLRICHFWTWDMGIELKLNMYLLWKFCQRKIQIKHFMNVAPCHGVHTVDDVWDCECAENAAKWTKHKLQTFLFRSKH